VILVRIVLEVLRSGQPPALARPGSGGHLATGPLSKEVLRQRGSAGSQSGRARGADLWSAPLTKSCWMDIFLRAARVEKPMSPQEIRDLIEADIDGDWSRTNLHGVELKTRLLKTPTLCSYNNSWFDGKAPETPTNKLTIELWLVLEEDPTSCGYSIVFNPDKNMFGLSVDKTFIGYYGSFLDTFAAM
jgi:hypothetical protein